MKRVWGAILAVALFSSSAEAAWPPDSVRYVRADAAGGGNGRTNTPSGAWTLSEANAQLTAGYTAIIGAGNYNTGISPVNHGDIDSPWGESGTITYVGNLANARACSLSSISVNRRYVTVKGVTVKANGGISLGTIGAHIGSSFAEYDSIYRVNLTKGTTDGSVGIMGAQNWTVASCSLMTYTTGSGVYMTAEQGDIISPACSYPVDLNASPPYDCRGTVECGRRVTQYGYFLDNYLWIFRFRWGNRKFLLASHTQNVEVARNRIRMYGDFKNSTENASCIAFELTRAYNNSFHDNKVTLEADTGTVALNPTFDDYRIMVLRDSSRFNFSRRDTFYAGFNHENVTGYKIDAVPFFFSLGQSGSCDTHVPSPGSFDNTFRKMVLVSYHGINDKKLAIRATVESCLIVARVGQALNMVQGEPQNAGLILRNNTFVSRTNPTIKSLVPLPTAQITKNIFYCDSLLPLTNPGGSSGLGPIVEFPNPGTSVFTKNLYYARTHGAVSISQDSIVKIRGNPNWSGVGATKPWCTVYGSQDCGGRFGSPGYADYTNLFTDTPNARPSSSSLARAGSLDPGYIGCCAPKDNVSPSSGKGLISSANIVITNPDAFTKTWMWTESGNDSMFFAAESVFICERIDSTRIDNTNWRSYVIVSLAAGAPNDLRSYTCSPFVSEGGSTEGCGSDAIGITGHIGYNRIVTKDADGNVGFSVIWEMVLTP